MILLPFLKDPSPMIREYAAWAILNIDYEYGRNTIMDILEYEQDEIVKLEMEKLLVYFNIVSKCKHMCYNINRV